LRPGRLAATRKSPLANKPPHLGFVHDPFRAAEIGPCFSTGD
jgi:hypothetical protein